MDYAKLLIKEYGHWLVQVHENQGYLGRCVVWCKREDALALTDATKEECDELLMILRELTDALERAFGAEWFNYAFLGNETAHLHGHVIPRYSTKKEFNGVIFRDEQWGHNYTTDHSFVTTPELLEAVRLELAGELNKKS